MSPRQTLLNFLRIRHSCGSPGRCVFPPAPRGRLSAPAASPHCPSCPVSQPVRPRPAAQQKGQGRQEESWGDPSRSSPPGLSLPIFPGESRLEGLQVLGSAPAAPYPAGP